ncbi:MAG TPA: hypothetical protein VFB37_02775 [Steroidobacteraceae bacterium]|nr:hypothetical protein [Steroidobacteraceae bacterium]
MTPGKKPMGAAPLAQDGWELHALEFLERSREVADERIVDAARCETSTSSRETAAHPGALSPVR